MNSLFRDLINIGSERAINSSDKRNIQLANFISLLMAGAYLTVLVVRLAFGQLNVWLSATLMLEVPLFLALIWLNKQGFNILSRILLSWMPAILLLIDFKILILNTTVETSHYVGFRVFQLSFGCFPLLVFHNSEWRKVLIAFAVPLMGLLFFDKILTWMGVGYFEMGLTDQSYLYNNFRVSISFLVIGLSFIFLKRIIESQEVENKKLIDELAQKNLFIQKNAEAEVSQLNKQLFANLDALTKNEEQLAQHQRQLKRAYERLSYHINNTPLAVIERDKDFKITYWNKRAEELFGWPSEEVMGLRPQDFLIDASDKALAVSSMELALNNKRESNFMELRTNTRGGRVLNCLWYYSFLRDDQEQLETVLSFVSDITEQRRANYFLNERIKELQTLYHVSQLLTTSGKSLEEVFTNFPDMLPSGWQYPEICAARLKVFDGIYQTQNFTESKFKQSARIEISGQPVGLLEIVYLEERPADHEGPFFKEERDLLNAIAGMLQVYIERKLEENELTKAQANLSATINNTEIIIWSVDQNFKLTSFNEPFRKFAGEVLGVEIDQRETLFPQWMREKWIERYKRVLTGELLTLEETSHGIDFKFSLSPIIENDKVIGVSVFADNITEQNVQNRELAEANKKITELKMMALRSVMNPHFIFNVLSSIQYFITRNDELNAINYLTSFSKLMRTVLTRSVADHVSLKDELDLLRDYVHLEKLRFEEKFDFNIECNDDIESESIKLPSLLIQPYVENAILHGLYNKEGKGSLLVRVTSEEDFLVFEIEDDGIGREAAMRIRAKSGSNRKSMGTQLTEERLAILNADALPPVVYTDLHDGNKSSGTRVTIRIKINPN